MPASTRVLVLFGQRKTPEISETLPGVRDVRLFTQNRNLESSVLFSDRTFGTLRAVSSH